MRIAKETLSRIRELIASGKSAAQISNWYPQVSKNYIYQLMYQMRHQTVKKLDDALVEPKKKTKVTTKPDMVNHPPHYTQGKYEVIDVLEAFAGDDPLIWQVLKYTLRYKHKGAAKEDLMKARWYLDRKIGEL